MIQVFKDGKHYKDFKHWDSLNVPNDSWIYDGRKVWFHKLIDRLAIIDETKVPAVYRAWVLIT